MNALRWWPRPDTGERRLWWSCLACFAVVFTGWSLIVPLFGSPDEYQHVVRAAGVGHLEIVGREMGGTENLVAQHVPTALIAGSSYPDCFSHHTDTPASCAPAIGHNAKRHLTTSSAGRYPPLFYVLVGTPLDVWPGPFGLYLSRLVGALICAAFAASAVATANAMGGSRQAVVGVAVAMTPMAVSLAGATNPNGLETMTALSLWASGAAIALADGAPRTRHVVRLAVAGSALALMRIPSPLWVALALGAAAVLAGRRTWRLLGDRRVRVALGAIAVALVLAGIWLLAVGALDVGGGAPPPGTPIFRTVLGRQGWLLKGVIGYFGFLDLPAPALTYAAWYLAVGGLAVAAVAVGPRRHRALVAGIAFAVVAVPVVLEAREAHLIGFYWQGRYTLPLAVGLPVVAGALLSRWWAPPRRVANRHAAIVLGLTAAGHAAAFLLVAQRYSVGVTGPVLFLLHPRWQPPVPIALVVPIVVAGLAATAIVLQRAVAAPAGPPEPVAAPA